MVQYAPIALFVYNRPEHTQQVINALRNNYLARDSQLFIFSEAPKGRDDEEKVLAVRNYIATVEGFNRVNIIKRERNLGLAESIITGVTQLTAQYGRVIVLEDDLVTSPYFLKFMNDGLSAYEDEDSVISICGYMYPVAKKHADVIFLRIADCWGWATWKRGWDLFMADGEELYTALKAKKLLIKFNLDGAYNYTRMLKRQIQGKNDSWAVRWYASAILKGKLSLYPGQSLVVNIGIDGSGRHRGSMGYFNTELLNESIVMRKVPIAEDVIVIREIESLLWRQKFNIVKRMLEFFNKRKYKRGPVVYGWYK